jgi:iron complex transport system substrate-binding protein
VRRLALLLLVLAVPLLAACGEGPPQTPAQETRQPLKIQHALGNSKVPGRAKRPVTLATSELEDSIALGVRPVGATVPVGGAGFPRFLGARTRGIAEVGAAGGPDLERISALGPDVILGVIPADRRFYRHLSEISPTVIADSRVSWKPNLRQDGEALGLVDRAEAMLSDYDRRALRVRRALAGHRPTLAALEGRLPAEVRPYLGRPFVASILDDVGLPHPAPRQPAARPGRYDEWSLGHGVLAARVVLDDLERWVAGR